MTLVKIESFELTTFRIAARTVARWQREYGPNARQMVIEHLSGLYGEIGPEFRAAYLSAFGR